MNVRLLKIYVPVFLLLNGTYGWNGVGCVVGTRAENIPYGTVVHTLKMEWGFLYTSTMYHALCMHYVMYVLRTCPKKACVVGSLCFTRFLKFSDANPDMLHCLCTFSLAFDGRLVRLRIMQLATKHA